MAVGIFSLIVSCATRRKLNKMHTLLVTGNETNNEVILQKFREHDADGSGYLDHTELANVATALGVTALTKNELNAVFDLLDQDNNGKLDENEFRSWWIG